MDHHLAAPSRPNITNIGAVAALCWPQDSPNTVTGPFRISTGFPILPDHRGTARYSVSKRTVARSKMPVKVRLKRVWPFYRLFYRSSQLVLPVFRPSKRLRNLNPGSAKTFVPVLQLHPSQWCQAHVPRDFRPLAEFILSYAAGLGVTS